MYQRHALKVAAVMLFFLSPVDARADHHEPGEVEAATKQFYGEMASGDFDKAFSHMALGARGYLPSGVLSEIPDEQTRQMVVGIYQKAYDEGARINLIPKYIEVTTHGSVAIATFLTEGTVVESGDDDSQRVLNRVSLVWTNTDSGWKIIHWHASKSESADEDD